MTAAATTRPLDDDARHLIVLAAAGDRSAFAELYQRHYDQVFGYLYLRTHQDYHLSQDLTSDVFVRAFNGIGNFGRPGQGVNVTAWLFTIAHNRLADYWKSARVRTASYFDLEAFSELPDQARAADVEQVVLADIDSVEVARAMQALGDKQRECLTLRYIRGLNIAQTATVLGSSEGAVKALQFRAERNLAALLSGRVTL